MDVSCVCGTHTTVDDDTNVAINRNCGCGRTAHQMSARDTCCTSMPHVPPPPRQWTSGESQLSGSRGTAEQTSQTDSCGAFVLLCGFDRCFDNIMTFADGVKGRVLRSEGDVCAALGHWSLFLDGPVSCVTEQSLFSACRAGRVDAIDSIVSRYRIDVNSADENGWTPLHVAMVQGDPNVIGCLLRLGAVDVETEDGIRCSWMRRGLLRPRDDATLPDDDNSDTWGSRLSLIKTVQALLGMMKDGTPSEIFVRRVLRSVDRFGIAVLETANPRWSSLQQKKGYWSVFRGSVWFEWLWLTRLCLECGADVDGSVDGLRDTALHFAAACGSVESVKLLLGAGADVDAANVVRETPLRCACNSGHRKCLQLLLDAGADVNGRNEFGFTALHDACRAGDSVCVKLLLDAGANANSHTHPSGRSPLKFACERNSTECVRLVLEAGARVNASGDDGCTALHFACGCGAVESMRLLLEHGADGTLVTTSGDRAVHYADLSRRQTTCVALLESAGFG